MTTERNKRIGRSSIDRAAALCVCTKKRKAMSAIDAGDEYFENCGWWLSSMISRGARKNRLTVINKTVAGKIAD